MKKLVCSLVIVMVLCSCSYGEVQNVNLDLTKFSSVMAYSGLFNILANPYAYVGKVIKLKGTFDVYHDEDTNTDYFGVIIMDSSACCAMGLDFVLKASYKYPDDYPEIGSVITVSGKFEIDRDGEDVFCRLSEADIL